MSTRQDRTIDVDIGEAMIRSIDSDSIVLAGHTYDHWNGTDIGFRDFAAVKLDLDGQEMWRWQVGLHFPG